MAPTDDTKDTQSLQSRGPLDQVMKNDEEAARVRKAEAEAAFRADAEGRMGLAKAAQEKAAQVAQTQEKEQLEKAKAAAVQTLQEKIDAAKAKRDEAQKLSFNEKSAEHTEIAAEAAQDRELNQLVANIPVIDPGKPGVLKVANHSEDESDIRFYKSGMPTFNFDGGSYGRLRFVGNYFITNSWEVQGIIENSLMKVRNSTVKITISSSDEYFQRRTLPAEGIINPVIQPLPGTVDNPTASSFRTGMQNSVEG